MNAIPFNRPFIVGRELHYISQAVLEGHLSGDGRFTKLCHAWIEHETGTQRAMLTHSCTAATEIAALLCRFEPGDEVIMPSYNFVSTANAFLMHGATIRFIDIRPDTLNLDERQLESLISSKTRAIVPVHYAGVSCETDTIVGLARRHNLIVIEDAAQGVGATYKGRALGSIGQFGAYSFHETKNYISGEGGALLINDASFIERAEIIREKGTDRAKFFRGELDKYSWVDVGSSYLPSELIGAFLYAQLEAKETITERRFGIWNRYREGLAGLERRGDLRGPVIPDGCGHNAHMYYILAGDLATREALISHLRKLGIHAVFHYVPLHTSPMGRKLGYRDGQFPVTENLSERVIRLPFYFDLTESDQARVIAGVSSFFSQ